MVVEYLQHSQLLVGDYAYETAMFSCCWDGEAWIIGNGTPSRIKKLQTIESAGFYRTFLLTFLPRCLIV